MRDAIAYTLLALSVAVQLVAVLGVVLIPDALDAAHFLAASTLAVLCLCAAVLVRASFSLIGLTALLLAALCLITGPVLSHVTARAIHRARQERR